MRRSAEPRAQRRATGSPVLFEASTTPDLQAPPHFEARRPSRLPASGSFSPAADSPSNAAFPSDRRRASSKSLSPLGNVAARHTGHSSSSGAHSAITPTAPLEAGRGGGAAPIDAATSPRAGASPTRRKRHLTGGGDRSTPSPSRSSRAEAFWRRLPGRYGGESTPCFPDAAEAALRRLAAQLSSRGQSSARSGRAVGETADGSAP